MPYPRSVLTTSITGKTDFLLGRGTERGAQKRGGLAHRGPTRPVQSKPSLSLSVIVSVVACACHRGPRPCTREGGPSPMARREWARMPLPFSPSRRWPLPLLIARGAREDAGPILPPIHPIPIVFLYRFTYTHRNKYLYIYGTPAPLC